MSDAPSLPAQTPINFVGGGGSGTTLTGECASAVADAGLSPVDFGPLSSVATAMQAAHEQTSQYTQAGWIAILERQFEIDPSRRMSSREDETRLARGPSHRARHVAMCAAAPLVSPRFFQRRPGDSRTNHPQALGYSYRLAPSGPHYVGPTMRTAVHRAFTTLVPPLRNVTSISSEVVRALVAHAAAEMLRSARHEDAPRLRSTSLAASTRPRQAESEQRRLMQERPIPPPIAAAVSPNAQGARAQDMQGAELESEETQHSGAGCVRGSADAQQAAMRDEVRRSHDEEHVEASREAAARERASTQEVTRLNAALARHGIGSPQMGTMDDARDEASRREVVGQMGSALAERRLAAMHLASLGALRAQALELGASAPRERPELGGRMVSARTAFPLTAALETASIRDE